MKGHFQVKVSNEHIIELFFWYGIGKMNSDTPPLLEKGSKSLTSSLFDIAKVEH